MGLSLIIVLPLFFIPGGQILSGAVFFGTVSYAIMPYDILMDFLDEGELEGFLETLVVERRLLAIVVSFLPMIPLIGFFAPFLTALILTHLLLSNLKSSKANL